MIKFYINIYINKENQKKVNLFKENRNLSMEIIQ